MKRHTMSVTIILIAFAALFLVGCSDLEKMIEDATQRTITVDQTILDSTGERNIKSAPFAEELRLEKGTITQVGFTEINDLQDAITVSQVGMSEVRFFVRGHVRNMGTKPALIRLAVIPVDEQGELPPMEIGSITLGSEEELKLENPWDMDQSADTIHERLTAIYYSLDNRFLINPIIKIEGNTEDGVEIGWIKLAAVPVYWRSESIPTNPYSEYKKNLREVYGAKLSGSLTNEGDNLAEVSIYLGTGEDEVDVVNDLIAHAYLSPGETLQGFEMLVEGGNAKIRDSIEKMIQGEAIHRDLVIVSTQPLKVKGDNLRLEAKVVVGVDIF